MAGGSGSMETCDTEVAVRLRENKFDRYIPAFVNDGWDDLEDVTEPVVRELVPDERDRLDIVQLLCKGVERLPQRSQDTSTEANSSPSDPSAPKPKAKAAKPKAKATEAKPKAPLEAKPKAKAKAKAKAPPTMADSEHTQGLGPNIHPTTPPTKPVSTTATPDSPASSSGQPSPKRAPSASTSEEPALKKQRVTTTDKKVTKQPSTAQKPDTTTNVPVSKAKAASSRARDAKPAAIQPQPVRSSSSNVSTASPSSSSIPRRSVPKASTLSPELFHHDTLFILEAAEDVVKGLHGCTIELMPEAPVSDFEGKDGILLHPTVLTTQETVLLAGIEGVKPVQPCVLRIHKTDASAQERAPDPVKPPFGILMW